MHRVLRAGGRASILDLRQDASLDAIDEEVHSMNLARPSAALTRWIFRSVLLKNAYTRQALERMAAQSRFGRCEISEEGVGFDICHDHEPLRRGWCLDARGIQRGTRRRYSS
jgi:hypothetical protein